MIIYDKDGIVLLDIEVDDTSVRYKAIKGENSLTLKFSLAEHVEVPIGAYCVFKDEVYTLMLPEDLTLNHRRSFEYSLVMYTEDAKSKRYMFVNPVDGRLKFTLTAKPIEHLQMFVDNMNSRDGVGGWEVGDCVDHVEIVLSYNHTFCHDALVQLADEMKLDYWFDGKTVNLGKLELNREAPLPLSYGGDGEGLKPNVKRTNYADALPLEVLYVQGSETNIDPSKYGATELHLPKSRTIGYDGACFSGEDKFDASKARYYKTDARGFYVTRADKGILNHSEDSLDCSEIEPTKTEKVHSVVVVNADKHYYDILFESSVDYSKYIIEGENASVVFQSGMLAGKEFDLATNEAGDLICRREGNYWRVEIVPQDIDGITMPDEDSGYMPVKDNEFKVFGIQLPDEYVAEAELEMLKYAVKHFYDNEDVQYTIAGELDEIYAKNNWASIKEKIVLGGYVSFSDRSFQEDPLMIRITGIKEFVNKPYSPVLEISNAALSGTLIGSLNRIENQEAETDSKFKEARNFTKRRFSSALETISMLKDAFKSYSDGINPVTVQTMAMLLGDESLQFKFISPSGTSDESVDPEFSFSTSTKVFKVGRQTRLMHMTLGINEVTCKDGRAFDDYLKWQMPSWESEVLDGEVGYYLYAVVPKDGTEGRYTLSPSVKSMEETIDGTPCYNLLVGILNKEYNGERDFVTLNGFTEVLPGQITTNVIRSADGTCYFDLEKNEIGGAIKFKAGTSGLENVEGLSEAVEGAVGGLEFGKYNLIRNSGFTGDFVTESLDGSKMLDAEMKLFSDPFRHWMHVNATIVDSEVSQSGKMCTIIDNGVISQSLDTKIIKGENYVLSFRARGVQMTCSVAGVSKTLALTEEWTRYVEKFTSLSEASSFTVSQARCDICEIQLERGNVVSAWGQSMKDNESSIAKYQSMQYLEAALAKGSTDILGGLICSNLLLLGNEGKDDNTAGVSGIYEGDDDVAFWGGGTYLQAIATVMKYVEDPAYQPTDAEFASMAKVVITHGGKAILNDIILRGYIYAVGGKIGNLRIEGNGISVDINNASNNGGSIRFSSQGFEATQKDGSFVQLGTCGSQAIIISGKDAEGGMCYGDEDKYKIAAQINAADNGHAIHCLSGLYAGLRPMITEVYESYTLTSLDHTLIVSNDNEITLTLEKYPHTGQTYKIIHRTDKKINISANHYVINVAKSWEEFSSFSNLGVVTLTYYDGLWYAEI